MLESGQRPRSWRYICPGCSHAQVMGWAGGTLHCQSLHPFQSGSNIAQFLEGSWRSVPAYPMLAFNFLPFRKFIKCPSISWSLKFIFGLIFSLKRSLKQPVWYPNSSGVCIRIKSSRRGVSGCVRNPLEQFFKFIIVSERRYHGSIVLWACVHTFRPFKFYCVKLNSTQSGAKIQCI